MAELASNPIVLALCASFLFGMSMLTTRNGLQYFDSTTGVMISVVSTAILYWLLAPMMLPARVWTLPGFWIFAAMGLAHPFISMWLNFEATRLLGATVAATVSSIAPLLSTVGAVVILGELPTRFVLAGTASVVAGVMILSWSGNGGERRLINPHILLPLATAAIRGMQHVISKYALTLTPVPFVGGFASYTVAGTVMVLAKQLTGTMPKSLRSMGTFWFCLTGLIVCGAILAMYGALSRGTVVEISPLTSSYPVFTLLGNLVFYPREVMRWRIWIGVAVVVGGVWLISGR